MIFKKVRPYICVILNVASRLILDSRLIMNAVLSIIFASVVCVYGLGDDGSKMQYCDNVDRIADSAWEMCGHHRKGFTWNDVEMCEVIKILISMV